MKSIIVRIEQILPFNSLTYQTCSHQPPCSCSLGYRLPFLILYKDKPLRLCVFGSSVEKLIGLTIKEFSTLKNPNIVKFLLHGFAGHFVKLQTNKPLFDGGIVQKLSLIYSRPNFQKLHSQQIHENGDFGSQYLDNPKEEENDSDKSLIDDLNYLQTATQAMSINPTEQESTEFSSDESLINEIFQI
jgi:hypothetical protein